MPKISNAIRKQTAAAEDSGGFEPLAPGVYVLQIAKDAEQKEGPKGAYWSWELQVVGQGYRNRKLWHNTSLSEKAAGMLKGFMTGFGVDLDELDATEDMVGLTARARVGQETQTVGQNAGTIRNKINGFLAKDPDAEDALQGDEDEAPRAGKNSDNLFDE